MMGANKPHPSLEDVRKLEEEAIRKRKQEREDKRQERKVKTSLLRKALGVGVGSYLFYILERGAFPHGPGLTQYGTIDLLSGWLIVLFLGLSITVGYWVGWGKLPRMLRMGSDDDDFGKHVIPAAIEKLNVYAHTFDGYWEDIGTIAAFYRANIRLTDLEPAFHFYQPDAPIFTHQRYLAGTRMLGCRVYFCDPAYADHMSDIYERYHARVREIHRRRNLPYAYTEFLSEMRLRVGS